jgi:hypothetical protein
MADGPEKPKEVKFYFTQAELREIDEFRMQYTTIHSRNHMAHLAMKYLMRKIKESGGHLTREGLPMEVMAEQESTYGQTDRRKSMEHQTAGLMSSGRTIKGGKKNTA